MGCVSVYVQLNSHNSHPYTLTHTDLSPTHQFAPIEVDDNLYFPNALERCVIAFCFPSCSLVTQSHQHYGDSHSLRAQLCGFVFGQRIRALLRSWRHRLSMGGGNGWQRGWLGCLGMSQRLDTLSSQLYNINNNVLIPFSTWTCGLKVGEWFTRSTIGST